MTPSASSAPASAPPLPIAVASSASVINRAVVPRAPSRMSAIAPSVNAAICTRGPACADAQAPRAAASSDHGRTGATVTSRVVPSRPATVSVRGPARSSQYASRQRRSSDSGSSGSASSMATARPRASRIAVTVSPGARPASAAGLPASTSRTKSVSPMVAGTGGRATRRRSGWDRPPATTSPDRMRPGPAVQDSPRPAQAWTPMASTLSAAARLTPMKAREGGWAGDDGMGAAQ